MRGFTYNFILAMILLCQISFATTKSSNVIKIGVLAHRGVSKCIKNWQSTADYLTSKLPDHIFKIIPLGFTEVLPAVKNNQIDFVIANSHFYILLNKYFSTTRVLTLNQNYKGKKISGFGGVLFCKANRKDIITFKDIANKKLVAVKELSIGGWLSQCRELLQNNIDPKKYCSSITFMGSHDKVVKEVFNGKADIGMVSTGILEKMVSDGKLEMSEIRTIPLTSSLDANFPQKISTRLYSRWPLSKLKNTSNALTNHIASILLKKSLNASDSDNISWSIPSNYSETNECLRELHLPPYDRERQKAITTIIKSDPFFIIVFISFLFALILLVIKTLSFNKRLQLSNNLLEAEIDEKIQVQKDLKHRLDTDQRISELMLKLTTGNSKVETIAANMMRIAVNSTKSKSGLIYTVKKNKTNILCAIIDGRAIIASNSLQKLVYDDFPVFVEKVINLEKSYSVFLNNSSEKLSELNLNQISFKFNTILISAIIGTDKDILGYIIVSDANEYNDLSVSFTERIAYILGQSLKDINQNNERIAFEQKLQRLQKLEALGTLASGISHDFKNILLPIIGFSEMILEDAEKDSSIYSSAMSILESANRAKELTAQILSISRVNKEKIETLCIQDIIDEVLVFLRASIPHTISIDKNCPQERMFINANSGQLHQVITNLCINAFHAMENKSGKLGISICRLKDIPISKIIDHKNYCCISISDTGTGIEKDALNKIFDPYFTTKEKDKGTGLGLAIAQAIIENLRGRIEVVSEVNVGTTFSIYLPLVKEVLKQNDNISDTEIDDKYLTRQTKQHVLVVDDDILILEMTKKLLLRIGLDVTSFSNSLEALDFFINEHKKIDIVISDMTMPNMTGDILAKKMYEVCPEVPFVLSTGISHDETSHLTDKEEISDLLPKPFRKKDIIKLLNKYQKKTARTQ